MNQIFRTACIQNCATDDTSSNIADCLELCQEAIVDGANLITLPEVFSCLHATAQGNFTAQVAEPRHPAIAVFSNLARESGIWINLGSLAIIDSQDNTRNRSYLINSDGEIVSRYDKIHMFDVKLPNGETFHESKKYTPGDTAVIADTPWGALGLTICYDVRFPVLYNRLARAGATMFTVPSAFTQTTGSAHWHALLRARAIETGSYIFAAGQFGAHGKLNTYGHSLIVNPWGEVLADAGTERGYICADIDLRQSLDARARIPALSNARDFTVQNGPV